MRPRQHSVKSRESRYAFFRAAERLPIERSPSFPATVATSLAGPFVIWLTTARTWDLGVTAHLGASGFFTAQAKALLNGRLWVAPDDLAGECFEVDDRCFGYFGITPSLVRLLGIPFGVASTPLWLSVAILMTIWLSVYLVATLVQRSSAPSGLFLWGAMIGLGVGSVLMTATRPFVYDEAIIWATLFVIGALLCFSKWLWYSRAIWLLGAALCGIAAANARPTFIVPSMVLGLGALVRVHRCAMWRQTRTVIAAVALIALPALTAAAVFVIKFGTPIPDLTLNEQVPEQPMWATILDRNGGTTVGLEFVPTAMFAYWRPDSVLPSREWPYVRFARAKPLYLPPLAKGGTYTEPTSSLPASMPLPAAALLIGAAWLLLPGTTLQIARADRFLCTTLLLTAALVPVVTVTNFAMTQRYLVDFYPLLAVGSGVFGFLYTRGRIGQRWLIMLAVGFTALSVLINIGIGVLISPPLAS